MIPPARRVDDVEWLIAKHLGDKLQFLGFVSHSDIEAIELIVNDVVRHRWSEIGRTALMNQKPF